MDIVIEADLLDFWLIILFSFLGVILSAKFRLPSIIGLLFFGALIGPNFLGLITETDFISIFSEIGVILLLFYIGIHFNMERISSYGLRAAFVLLMKFAIIFLITYLIAMLLGFSLLEAMILGVILSFSSTAIFARIVIDSKHEKRPESRFMSAVLILEDVVAVFALTFLSQLHGNVDLSAKQVLISVVVSLIILFCSYLILRWFVIRLSKWIEHHNLEAQLFSALSLCALLASIAMAFEISPSIGAFLAGSTVAAIPAFKKIEGVLTHMTFLFAAFFFFSMGMAVNLQFMLGAIGIVVFFAILNMLLKFLSITFSTYTAGFGSKASIFSGMVMLTSSEFALIIAYQTVEMTSFDFVSFSAALIIASGIISSLLIRHEEKADAVLQKRFRGELRRNPFRHLSMYMSHVLHHFEPGGSFYEVFRKKAKALLLNVLAIFVLNSIVLIFEEQFLRIFGLFAYPILGPFDAFEVSVFVLSLYPLYNIFNILSRFSEKFAQAFHFGATKDAGIRLKMFEDFLFFSLFLAISISIPFIINLLRFPGVLSELFILPLAMAALFLLDLTRLATQLLAPHEKHRYNIPGYRGRRNEK